MSALRPIVHLGAFCLYYGFEPRQKIPSVLVLQRGTKYRGINGKEGAGNPGGHVNLASGSEQPDEAAVRELKEEVVFPNGSPVLPAVTKERLEILATGIDYSGNLNRPASPAEATMWVAYACQLNTPEMQALRLHVQRFSTDLFYARKVGAVSKNEVGMVFLLAADRLLKEIRTERIVYANAHGQDILLKLLDSLTEQACRSNRQNWRKSSYLRNPYS